MRRGVSWAVAIALVVGAAEARADEATTCIAAFEEGQKLSAAGKLLAARDQLDACAKPSCPGAVRTDCLERRDKLERAIPTIAVAVRDAGGSDLEATLLVDGKPFEAPKGRAVAIDPGLHTFGVVRAGKVHETQATIVEGEKSRILVLTWKDDARPAPAPAPVAPAPEQPSTGAGPWPTVLIVGGSVLIVGGLTFQLLAIRANNEAKDLDSARRSGSVDCALVDPNTVVAGSTCGSLNESYDTKKSLASRNQTVAIVASVTGIGLLAGGIIWSLTSSSKTSARVRVVPVVDVSTTGAALTGTF